MNVAMQVVENSEQASTFTYSAASFPSSAQKQSRTVLTAVSFHTAVMGVTNVSIFLLKKHGACLVEGIHILAVMYLQKNMW